MDYPLYLARHEYSPNEYIRFEQVEAIWMPVKQPNPWLSMFFIIIEEKDLACILY